MAEYEEWLRKNKVQESPDYDMRAAHAAGVEPDARGHFPDTYKLPSHITYSDESIYSKGKNAPAPGKWAGSDDKGWTFSASDTNIKNAGGVDKLRHYFETKEPGTKLILPTEIKKRSIGEKEKALYGSNK